MSRVLLGLPLERNKERRIMRCTFEKEEPEKPEDPEETEEEDFEEDEW
jgi:hypothetical protein